jgi:hypothetical protein
MRCGEAAAPERSIEGGRILDPAAAGQALRQLLARSDISANRALIAASDDVASFRVLTFPLGVTDTEIDTVVRSQVPLHSDRLARRYVEVLPGRPERTIFATVWDRSQVRAITETARHAGLEPAVVDLKSLCVARAIPMPSCVFLDLSSDPFEVVLIDDHLPRVRHAFKIGENGDLPAELARGVKPVLGYYRSSASTVFGPESPILVRSDQALPSLMASRLDALTGHPVVPMPQPARIDPEVRFGPFLTCIGLAMRRRA